MCDGRGDSRGAKWFGFPSDMAKHDELVVSSDRVCQVCRDGTFNRLVGSGSCQPTSLCGLGFGQSVAPTPSSDRQCEACQEGMTFSGEVT